VFRDVRAATERVAERAWGDGADDVGLEHNRPDESPSLGPIGGSSFDVDRDGRVFVLDEAHRRLFRWDAPRRDPTRLSLAINGTLADMTVDENGDVYVLESTENRADDRILRIFGRDGTAQDSVALAERADQVRTGPSGAVVLAQPSGQWLSATAGREPLPASAQRRSARSGRPLPGGDEVVVLRTGNEIRLALVRAGRVLRSWRVTSNTAIAEVQLVETLGQRVVVVARVYSDREDEFVALVLGVNGVEQAFSLESADWAETAPLSRFRVARSSLYHLGSTPSGLFVDRFQLEVK
jgi:hypothetical protein